MEQTVREKQEVLRGKSFPVVKASSPSGIVIPAGGQVFLRNAAALVQVLRQHHLCTISIEIAYWGQDEIVEPLLSRIEV